MKALAEFLVDNVAQQELFCELDQMLRPALRANESRLQQWRFELVMNTSVNSVIAKQFVDRVIDVLMFMASVTYRQAGEVRGAVLELFLYRLIEPRYADSNTCQHELECEVHINGQATSHTPTPQTMDVGGWQNQTNQGEVYECKMGYRSIEDAAMQDKLRYVDRLCQCLLADDQDRRVGVACPQPTKLIHDTLRAAGFTRIGAYGRDRYLDIAP